MHEVQGPAKSFNDRWIEIGYYTGWYPVCNGTSADRSHLRIGITDGYTVSGSGIISRTDDGMWEMDQLRHFGRLQPQKLHYAQFRVFQRIYTQKYRP